MKVTHPDVSSPVAIFYARGKRLIVSVSHRKIDDQTIETEQGKSHTVAELYKDYVLGKLDPSQLVGSAVYDEDGSDDVDPLNHFGVTLEESTRISDAGTQAAGEVATHQKKKQAEAAAAAAAKAEEELKAKLRAEIEAEGKGDS